MSQVTMLVTVGNAIEDANSKMTFLFEHPEVESMAILSGLLNCSRTALYLQNKKPLSPEIYHQFMSLVERRTRREPVAYLLGKQNFWGRDFFVDQRVLIPRPETETIIDLVNSWNSASPEQPKRVLELGVGSGAISVTMALEFKNLNIVAGDISSDALTVAAQNAKAYNVDSRIQFVLSDLAQEIQGDFDMIVSNPPYVSTQELAQCDPDLGYEPVLSLSGGHDGLSVLRPLIFQAKSKLKPNGALIVEIGYRQSRAVEEIMIASGFKSVTTYKDINNQDRFVQGDLDGSI